MAKKNLLILVNGTVEKISQAHNLDLNDYDVVKVDEKMFLHIKNVIRTINSGNYLKVYFSCIDIDFQRFLSFMLLFIFLSKVKNGGIIDETGRIILYKLVTFLLIKFPFLTLEYITSVPIITYFYLKLGFKRWISQKN